MGEQLYQYKKFYEDGKTVWKRVPYDGGNADAVFPNTPEDQRNGKVPFAGSTKIQQLKEKQELASSAQKLRSDLDRAGYKEVKCQLRWKPEGTCMLATLYWSGPFQLELLEMEFTFQEFTTWLYSDKSKVGPNPIAWRCTPNGDGKDAPHNPIARYLLERDKLSLVEESSPGIPYNRKLDVE